MIPTLFEASYVASMTYSGDVPTFPEHGIIDLVDCIECYAEQVDDEDSCEWELAFTYPLGGIGFDYLKLDNVVLAKVNSYQGPQAFRIYAVEKNISKTVSVKCQHISYDMVNVPVKPFSVESPQDAIKHLKEDTIYGADNWKQHRFYFETDLESTDKFEFDEPRSMRAVLLNGEDSIKGTYGGDLDIDNYYIRLLKTAGEDRDITIVYGIDLVDMTQEENNSDMITGIYPYYRKNNNSGKSSLIYGDVTYGPGTYTVQKIEAVDLTQFFRDQTGDPTVAQINAKAQQWVEKEEIGEPEISLTLTYAMLGQDVRLHDAIRVYFPSMGIDKKAKVTKYKYNVLLEQCEEVEVGKPKASQLFNLMDASRLKKGLLPPDRIANSSISSSKYGRGSVSSSAIGNGAVLPEYHIPEFTIDHDRLMRKEDGRAAVRQDNIAMEAVGSDEIKDKAVVTSKVAKLAIDESRLGNAAVAWEKLKSSQSGTEPADRINALEADMAYVNKLFASTAQIDYIRAQHIYASSLMSTNLMQANTYRVGQTNLSGYSVKTTAGDTITVLGF